MKFVVDAQLPLRLARQLVAAGQEAVHTSDLVRGNRTSDTQLAAFADEGGGVLVECSKPELWHSSRGRLTVPAMHAHPGSKVGAWRSWPRDLEVPELVSSLSGLRRTCSSTVQLGLGTLRW